jgi:2-methylcitrate dehydratase PrpD
VQAVIEIEMADGTTLSARCEDPRGSYENPLSRTQIEDKFRTYGSGVLSDAHIDEVIGAVDRLEDLGSVRELMKMLHAMPRARPMAVSARG